MTTEEKKIKEETEKRERDKPEISSTSDPDHSSHTIDEERHGDITADTVVHARRDINGGIKIFTNNSEREMRKGLPTKFNTIEVFKDYVPKKYEDECFDAIEHENILLISTADKLIQKAMVNKLYEKYQRLGYDIQELLFEDYDRDEISKLVEDIETGVIKYEEKLLLFVSNSISYPPNELPELVKILKTKSEETVGNYNRRLKSKNCKIVYASYFKEEVSLFFKRVHVPFLTPFLTFHGHLDKKEEIRILRDKSKLPKNELELHFQLKKAVESDNFEILRKQNKNDYSSLIKEHELYPYVLFIATFFRRLEFDDFERLLIFVIEEYTSRKKQKKFSAYWHNNSDQILGLTSLNYKDPNNLRILDFSSEEDAINAKRVLFEEKRFFIDKMAKIVCSESCIFEGDFHQNTLKKINSFVAELSMGFGSYFSFLVPIALLDSIELKRKNAIGIREKMEELRSLNNDLSNKIEKLKELRDKEDIVEYFIKRSNPLVNSSIISDKIEELNLLRFLIDKTKSFPKDFDPAILLNQLILLKNKVRDLIEKCNENWVRKYNSFITYSHRFVELLMTIDLVDDSGNYVNEIVNKGVNEITRYYSIFDLLNIFYFKSEMDIFLWYKMLLSNEKRKVNTHAFDNILYLILDKPLSFFYTFERIKNWFPAEEKEVGEYTQLERYSISILFLYHNTVEKWEDETVFELFNSNMESTISYIPDQLKLLLTDNLKDFLMEVDSFLKPISVNISKRTALILFNWYSALNRIENREADDVFRNCLRAELSGKKQLHAFKNTLGNIRNDLNDKIIGTKAIEEIEKLELKREQLSQFSKLII